MTQGPEGYEMNPDQEAVDQQVRALERLQDPDYKEGLEDEMLEQRQEIEPWQPGFRRVALERTAKLDGEGRLLVVAREVLAPSLDDDVRADHRLEEIEDGEDLCCDLKRYRILDADTGVARAVRNLRDRGVDASANHVVMLGNTSKGGDSPSATHHDPGTRGDGEPTALIVVIDTGLDALGPDRENEWLREVHADERDLDPLDEVAPFGRNPDVPLLDLAAGHGSFVAGTIRRVEPGASVRVLRALDTEGLGGEDMIAAAICRAAEIFADEPACRGVLNLSLGMETIDDQPPLAIACALQELPPDVVVVAAAGNEPTGRPLWPAAFDGVIAVAGLCDDLRPSSWSNRGKFVDFATRAEGIVSTFVAGRETPHQGFPPPDTFPANQQEYPYAAWTGTSFAAPQVSARIARYIADLEPRQPVEDAVRRLRDGGIFMPDWGYTVGILPALDPPLRCSTERRS